MHVRNGFSRLTVLILVFMALAGCGNAPGAPPPEESLSSSAAGTPTGPVPGPVCEGGPLGCRLYRSTGGRDATGDLAWLKSEPLEVSMVFVNGTWTVGVKTPCNNLGVEVKVDGNRWLPGRIIATAMGCPATEGGYENWTHELFKQPVTWTLDGPTLLLRNSHGTVELTDSGPLTHM